MKLQGNWKELYDREVQQNNFQDELLGIPACKYSETFLNCSGVDVSHEASLPCLSLLYFLFSWPPSLLFSALPHCKSLCLFLELSILVISVFWHLPLHHALQTSPFTFTAQFQDIFFKNKIRWHVERNL